MAETAADIPAQELAELESVVIRFAGDSGDGSQLVGLQFTNTSAVVGNDISTLPDFPAEIRAPAGTLPGVSSFQVQIASEDIYTPGDQPLVLVAMNPASLKTNLEDLQSGGLIIVNTDNFTDNNLRKAGYKTNPLDDGSLRGYRLSKVPLTTLHREALKGVEGLTSRQVDMMKNMFALGLTFWIFDRPLDPTIQMIEKKFAGRTGIIDGNLLALKAGYHYGETTEEFQLRYRVPRAPLTPGVYRAITGYEATALGLVTAARLAGKTLFYGSYPITPASVILHELAALKHFGVRTFQAEDEIAAMGSTIGAAYGGALSATGTSGPGLALKSEAINLAVMLELPMVIINVQRGGPSTGLPTKTEQADLLQTLYGRNGESPIPVLAPATPGDCFDLIIEAFRIAIASMSPVIFLSDGYLVNSSEPWQIPEASKIPSIAVHHRTDPDGFHAYLRDTATLGRPWALPGAPGLEHRIGGLEKEDITGTVSYEPDDHEHMIKTRAAKVARIADRIPDQDVVGAREADLLVLGWGSTYGAIRSAVRRARAQGKSVASAHLRYLNPFPVNLGYILSGYKRILLPEMNMGQLAMLLKARFPVEIVSYPKVQGKPFLISEISQKIDELLR